ncbi:pogo transposable element with KRAB domain [Trichonephila clavipes]|nr:pogo transposable element with KRAB domain [Trichonephila clavipes]
MILRAVKKYIPRGKLKKRKLYSSSKSPLLQPLLEDGKRIFENRDTGSSTHVRIELNKTNANVKRPYVQIKWDKWNELCSGLDSRTSNGKLWEKNKDMNTARFFNVDESNIRLWRRNKTNFENCNRRKRADRRGKPHWPELEAEINKWILKERDDGKAVSTVSIRMKARVIAREMNIVNFSGGPTWCYRFMKRNNLVVRSCSTVGQKLPDDWGKKSDDFLTFCKQIIVENNFTEDLIFNMDEVPLSFDIPPTRTVDVQGASSIPINNTGNERTSFTVVLCCAANDVGINRSFKSKVRKLWEQWMSDGEKNYTKTGKLKRASYENVSRWVLKAWNDVAETTVKNAF